MTRKPRCPVCGKKVKIDNTTAYAVALPDDDDYSREDFTDGLRLARDKHGENAPPIAWFWKTIIAELQEPDEGSSAEAFIDLGAYVVIMHDECEDQLNDDIDYLTKTAFYDAMRADPRRTDNMTDTEMQHEVEIKPTNDGGSYAECSCMWMSEPFATENEALEAGAVHLRDPNRDEA